MILWGGWIFFIFKDRGKVTLMSRTVNLLNKHSSLRFQRKKFIEIMQINGIQLHSNFPPASKHETSRDYDLAN